MKSFAKYISKQFASFVLLVIALVILNFIFFGWTFHSLIAKDYGAVSPQKLLPQVAAVSTSEGTTEEIHTLLRDNHIWGMFLNQNGERVWSVNTPDEIPTKYTIADIAVFSKGYLKDYPVFVWDMDGGLLALGYPKDSYMKISSNYLSLQMVQTIPIFFAGVIVFDFLFLFLAYYTSKRKIIKSTEPIIASIDSLSEGKPISLSVHGELTEVADSIHKASKILSRQNDARANWISGVSHDIRTPLSMIMGYARRIADNDIANPSIKEQAAIIEKQSIKIKELVQDLNLVSQLEYEMQPLQKESVRLSKLLRSYVADLLNSGIPDKCSFDIQITPETESVMIDCDGRLISRAINNLVQNSIKHNPQGCHICLSLGCTDKEILLNIFDDGVGLSAEKLKELEDKPHYIESTDERLDLRHGLGLLLVKQIVSVHHGTVGFFNLEPHGFRAEIILPINNGIVD